MLWLVDTWPYEAEAERWCTALKSAGQSYASIRTVPFTDQFDVLSDNIRFAWAMFSVQYPTFVVGSVKLAAIARQRDWRPGSLYDLRHDYQYYSKLIGPNNMVNADAAFCRLDEVPDTGDTPIFVRPLSGLKPFGGRVFDSASQFATWRSDVLGGSSIAGDDVGPASRVLYAAAKDIVDEYRFFVVGDKVVAGSVHLRNRRLVNQPIKVSTAAAVPPLEEHVSGLLPQEIVDERMAMDYALRVTRPARIGRAYAVDVARLPSVLGSFRVVEVNCINHVGLYGADVDALVAALAQEYALDDEVVAAIAKDRGR